MGGCCSLDGASSKGAEKHGRSGVSRCRRSVMGADQSTGCRTIGSLRSQQVSLALRRLSLLARRGRWHEYASMLTAAMEGGYRLTGLREWMVQGNSNGDPTLILRHDVDDDPAAARRMSQIEDGLGL